MLDYQDNMMFAVYFMTSKEESHVQIMNLRNITFHVPGTPQSNLNIADLTHLEPNGARSKSDVVCVPSFPHACNVVGWVILALNLSSKRFSNGVKRRLFNPSYYTFILKHYRIEE